MARAAKVCTDPSCPNLQPCPVHERRPWAGSRRRERLRIRSGSRQQKLRTFVLHRDDFTCHRCGQRFEEDQLVNDHLIPLAEGGADDVENMAPICLSCDREKTAEEARRGAARC
jgi:5-methylcytosine-specific restriction protein A